MTFAALDRVEHRPWPLPAVAWSLRQVWSELLFAHWPLAPADLRALVPPELEIDTFERRAWVGVVPFSMSGVRLRGLPPIPSARRFPELNVRTYVRYRERSGVWFFSLDAASALAVAAARRWFHLPYFRARMRCEVGDGTVSYSSTRTHRGAQPASFVARYRPVGEPFEAASGSLEHFLVERYCLFAQGRGRVLFTADIHHAPWRLQTAEAELFTNTMASACGLTLPDKPPLLHFVARQEALAWSPRTLDPSAYGSGAVAG